MNFEKRFADRVQEIEYVAPGELIPNPKNARVHPKKQLVKLKAGISELGFIGTIIADADGHVLAGHARLQVASELNYEKVPVIRIKDLTAAERKAFALADNKLGDLSSFDDDLLAEALRQLESFDIPIELSGFETPEIDRLLDLTETSARGSAADADDQVALAEPPFISRDRDLWLMGDHRLLCGNALEAESYDALLGEERADLIFVDFPYNVPIQGHVSGLGKTVHREFAMASGEMSSEEFTVFLKTGLKLLTKYSKDGSIHYVTMDWRHIYELSAAGREVYTEFKNLCVWNKGSGGMGSLYRSQHELVFVYKNGKAPHQNNVELGKYGRTRTNVWEYPGMSSFGRGRDEQLAAHSTPKPVSLIADAIRDCSKRGELVLDAFAGSGTTIIAAERTGRRAACIEIDPGYVDVSVRRWQAKTGRTATLASDGRTFDEVRDARLGSSNEEAGA
jgi:DNA modification methylase